jgi:RHS repeat-associated protein
VQGNLLYTQGMGKASSYAYDAQDRLIVAGSSPSLDPAASGRPARRASYSRYFYDAAGNRVLAQEGIDDQADSKTNTVKLAYASASNRWQGSDAGASPAVYDAAGQPASIGQRGYVWNAMGQLTEVRQGNRVLASYSYNNGGQRISKTVDGQSTYYLYQGGQVAAELNAKGQITRQYVYLSNQPIAVIDTPDGAAPDSADRSQLAQIGADIAAAFKGWFGGGETLAYLHNNHLGAPELATDASGHPVWQAGYSPFGKLNLTNAGGRDAKAFTLNLRLPGQYEDQETGLYYNDHRYYDPQRGQYLTPDPLGLRGGINSYAYVAGNPLKYVDPSGLVLFAFDGTGNTNIREDLDGGSLSNVWLFRNAYNSGNRNYITGVGTKQSDKYGVIDPATYANGKLLDYATFGMPLSYVDQGGNYSGPARIDRMMLFLRDEASAAVPGTTMDIDIVGFSRGAAEAREFANRIVAKTTMIGNTNTGWYKYTDADGKSACQKVNFRFMGLFDSVLSTNFSGNAYNLAIPKAFGYVAQAVALNEYRSTSIPQALMRNPLPWLQHLGGFPLESIGASSSKQGAIRTERGFLGAHADIGGGFPDGENQLSLVALNWMATQAKFAGVQMRDVPAIPDTDPVLHDKSNAIRMGNPTRTDVFLDPSNPDLQPTRVTAEDRDVRGAVSGDTQRTMGFDNGSMTNADTHQYISYKSRDVNAFNHDSPLYPTQLKAITGTVDINGYTKWLSEHHYWDPILVAP